MVKIGEKIYSNNYFWRTWDGKEIDWVEEREGKLYGYELKWKPKGKKSPDEWAATYKNSEYIVISQNDYLKFIC